MRAFGGIHTHAHTHTASAHKHICLPACLRARLQLLELEAALPGLVEGLNLDPQRVRATQARASAREWEDAHDSRLLLRGRAGLLLAADVYNAGSEFRTQVGVRCPPLGLAPSCSTATHPRTPCEVRAHFCAQLAHPLLIRCALPSACMPLWGACPPPPACRAPSGL